MNKKYILVSIDDERSKHISEVLGNKKCKKIIGVLSEKEASEKDISDELKIPINTIEYNLNKLIKAGLIEKTKNFFWSKKGKKIDMYRISNKSIIISPKSQITSKLKTIVPVAIASIIGAIFIKLFFYRTKISQDFAVEFAGETGTLIQSSWVWFLIGALFAIIIYLIWNWRKL